MLEMAIVSFNKVRLQYYISKGSEKAKRINYLLHNPSRLFGTTLIGVNVATVVGSECAREFHSAIGIDPNLAPLTQVFFVIVFGELAPMFAARHYPEHVSMLGITLIYYSSRVMAPLIWIFGKISELTIKILGKSNETSGIFLSREELIKVVEDVNEEFPHEVHSEELTIITSNIFHLKEKVIEEVMIRLSAIHMLPSDATVIQMKNLLLKTGVDFVPIYHRQPGNIIAVARPRDLLRFRETARIRDCVKHPWYITTSGTLGDVLQQFRNNKENIAVVLNREGAAIGIITIDSLIEEVFGKTVPGEPEKSGVKSLVLKDYTLDGDMRVSEFNKEYGFLSAGDENVTLSDLIINIMGHAPGKGDQIVIGDFEMTIKEATLSTIKTVKITGRIN